MRKWQPTRLDRNQLSSSVAFHTSVDSSYEEYFYPHVYKGEWNSVLNDGLFFEIRAGQYGYTRPDRKLTDAPSFEDLGNSRVSGANRIADLNIRRNQVLGSLSYFKDGWAGNHNIKIGWEVFRETSTASEGDGSYNSVIHILRNGAPIEVYLLENPSTSENGMVALGAYINDTWKVSSRLSLNLGLRFDRYRNFLPEQEHPASRFNPTAIHFAGVDDLNTWSLFAPRVGATFDLAGNGKTVLKVNYGQYWWNPSYSLSSNVNPNPPQWSRRYAWTDPNRNGVWDPGEQGQLLATRGGVAGESLDPNLQDAFTREAVLWVEREVMPNFGVRTGFVWRGERQQYQRLNANQPYDAFNVPVSIPDPGPDGVRGNADDGPAISAFNLAAAYLTLAPSNVTRNVPNSDTNYYTWEMTATRRMSRRWSLLATYSHTWSQAQNSQFFGTAFRQNNLPVTPNDLINAGPNGQIRFRDWSAKLHGTWEAPLGLKVTPVLRHQAGQSFGRTLSASTNYGSIRIPAEPITARRQDNVNILDVRLEKVVKMGPGARLAPFVDFFNMFNSNAEQNITWSSGTSFLQPLSIVPPRLLRIGAKFEW
jgi:outer membrane receptor protein involved in Fe transport